MQGEQRAGKQDEEIVSTELFIMLWSYKQTCERHTFQTEVHSSSLLAIMIEIILCTSNASANVGEKNPETWEYYKGFSLKQTLWSRHPYLHITEEEMLALADWSLPRAKQETQGTDE